MGAVTLNVNGVKVIMPRAAKMSVVVADWLAGHSTGLEIDATETSPVCANCGGSNVEMREDRDDSTGYHSEELFCLDCRGSAE